MEPATVRVPTAAAGHEPAELCHFCIRRARRTCYSCNVGLCRVLRRALSVRRAEEASAEGAEEPHPMASSSMDAANALVGGMTNGATSAQGGEDVADPSPEGQDRREPFCITDLILLDLFISASRARESDEEAWRDREFFLNRPLSDWSQCWRCENCKRWELDLERCLVCRRWVCSWHCWPGVGTRCWDCHRDGDPGDHQQPRPRHDGPEEGRE